MYLNELKNGDIVGYCFIKENAEVVSPLGAKAFQAKIVRCLEINEKTKSILALSDCGKGLGMLDFKDVISKFHCTVFNGWILPPGNNRHQNMLFIAAVCSKVPSKDRELLQKLIIANSISLKKYCSVVYDRVMAD